MNGMVISKTRTSGRVGSITSSPDSATTATVGTGCLHPGHAHSGRTHSARTHSGRTLSGRTHAGYATFPPAQRVRLTQRGRFLIVILALLVVTIVALGTALRATAAPAAPPVGWSDVVVQPGDSLWALALEAQGGSGDPRELIDQIKSVNHLDSSSVAVGQRLWVPTS